MNFTNALDETRRDEAAHWFTVLRRGAMALEERQAFDAWRLDPLNQRALDHMHELWGEMSAVDTVGLPIRRSRPAPRRAGLAIAAAIAGVLVVGAGGLGLMRAWGPDGEVRTAVGEQQTRTLPDGSVMAVNVVSAVDYRMERGVRAVRLKDGEAAFHVKKDPSRPFVVEAGDYRIRAVGTAFNVRHRDGAVEVSVSEGVVAVLAAHGDRAGRELFRLSAGREAILTPASAGVAAQARVTPVAVDSVAGWRMRVVEYEDVPVRHIVEDLNRFFDRPLAVTDPSLAERRVTVRLHVEDRDRTLRTLSDLLGVAVEPGERADGLASR